MMMRRRKRIKRKRKIVRMRVEDVDVGISRGPR